MPTMPPTPPLPAPMSPLAKAAIGCAAALLVLGVAAAGLLRVRQLMRRMRQMRAEKERLEFEFAIAQHAMANGVQMHTPLSEFANTGADSRSVFHDSVIDYQCQGAGPSSCPPLVSEGSAATPATTTTTTALEGMNEQGGARVNNSPPPIRSDLSPAPLGTSCTHTSDPRRPGTRLQGLVSRVVGTSTSGGLGDPLGPVGSTGGGGDYRSRARPLVITHSVASLSSQGLSESLLQRVRSSDGSGSSRNPASSAPSEGARSEGARSEGARSEDGADGRTSCGSSRGAKAEAAWMSRTTWRRLDEALDALPAGLLVPDVDHVPAAVATHPQAQPVSSSRVPQTSGHRAPSYISSGSSRTSEGSVSELVNILGQAPG